MAFEPIHNDLINDFAWSILNRFTQHCNKEGIQPTFLAYTKYLISCNLIFEKTVAKYMVMELYPEALYGNHSKMDAISEIADRTGISEKHVYNMFNTQSITVFKSSKKAKRKTYNNNFEL